MKKLQLSKAELDLRDSFIYQYIVLPNDLAEDDSIKPIWGYEDPLTGMSCGYQKDIQEKIVNSSKKLLSVILGETDLADNTNEFFETTSNCHIPKTIDATAETDDDWFVAIKNIDEVKKYIASYFLENDIRISTDYASLQEIEEFEKTYLGEIVKEYGLYQTERNEEDDELFGGDEEESTDAQQTAEPVEQQEAEENTEAEKNQQKTTVSAQPTTTKMKKGRWVGSMDASHTKLTLDTAKGLTSKNPVFVAEGKDVFWIKSISGQGKYKFAVQADLYSNVEPLKVKLAPHGRTYNQCELYFLDRTSAEAYMDAINAVKPADVDQYELKAVKADANNYEKFYEVNTEFGKAYVAYWKLEWNLQNTATNESLEEDAEEAFITRSFE